MSSGLPEATFSLIRSASGKSLTFTGPSAHATSGDRTAAASTRAAIFILVISFLPFLNWSTPSRRTACGPFVDADRDNDDEADQEFLHERRDSHEDEPVAHHPDDEHAENRAQDRSLAARKRCAADDGCGDHVEFEAESGPPGLAAGKKGKAQDPRKA